jgi:hypothetical protein
MCRDTGRNSILTSFHNNDGVLGMGQVAASQRKLLRILAHLELIPRIVDIGCATKEEGHSETEQTTARWNNTRKRKRRTQHTHTHTSFIV